MDHIQSTMANLNLTTPGPAASRGAGRSHRSDFLSANFETPHKQNMSSTNVFINGSLDEQKKAVEEDLGPIPEVTVNFMLEHIVPNVNLDVGATLETLKSNGILTESHRWKPFDVKSPSRMSTSRTPSATNTSKKRENMEVKIFQNMENIYDAIISCAQFHDQKRPTPTLAFKQNPDRAPLSNTRVRTRPDGYGVLKEEQKIHTDNVKRPSQVDGDWNPTSSKPNSRKLVLEIPKPVEWFDIACMEEYKLHDRPQDRNDNVLKIIWSLHHIMNFDHRRRFTFGITIENENARIWFACRQIVMVSQPFNFNTNSSQLVRLIAALAYATPTQLGYDPTMTLQWGEKYYCYDIECTTKGPDGSNHTQMYRTQQVISDKAFNLRGRATRVYLVKLITDKDDPSHGPLAVLKDSWIDVDRSKEGDILEKLLAGASEDDKKNFLPVAHHGVVQIDNQDDSTEELILKGQKIQLPSERRGQVAPNPLLQPPRETGDLAQSLGPIQDGAVPDLQDKVTLFHLSIPESTKFASEKGPSERPTGDGLRQSTHHVFKKPIEYSPKVHYRIVFKRYGKPLKWLLDHGEATSKIILQVMRDIAKGEFIYVDDSHHDLCLTNTIEILALQFMAKRGYVHRDVSIGNAIWFRGHARLSDLEHAKRYAEGACSFVRTGIYHSMAGEAMKRKYSVTEYMKQNSKIPFIYNPIHDLESLWWTGVYCVLYHYPASFNNITQLDSTSGSQDKYRDFNSTELEHINQMQVHGQELFPSIYGPLVYDFRMEEIHDETRFESRIQDNYPAVIQAIGLSLNNIRQCISWAYQEIQSGLPRPDAAYFTDVLRIADPTIISNGSKTPADKSVQASVHDRVLQILEILGQAPGMQVDVTLWPLDSTEKERNDWTKTHLLKSRLRTRKQPHGFINMDSEQICYED